MATKLCVSLALVVLLGIQTPAQQFPPGFVDPAPLLAAAAKEIGEANFRCVTFSGAGYSARRRPDLRACGQHRLAADRSDGQLHPDHQLGNRDEQGNLRSQARPESRVLEVRPWMGRRDADAEEPPADAHHQRQIFMVHRRRRASCRRSARGCRALPVGLVDEPSGIHQGRPDARREPQGLLALGAD